ncbi:MAG TPA: cobalamin-binding protein [Terriglobia bacterium]|nr:cobalamin-binding protein [Terriglobia bacterium]
MTIDKLFTMRICSLLPSATETLFELGAGDSVAGITFECDFPPEAKAKRVVVRTRLEHSEDPVEIDRQVKNFVARGESLYEIDHEAVQAIEPDLIITQDLCHVCAASPGDLGSALATLARKPEVLSLNPRSLGDVWKDILSIGRAIGRTSQARVLVAELEGRISAVAKAVSDSPNRPRVACLEWLDPPFIAGHWVPEMVACAGGVDVFGKAAQPSFRQAWEAVLRENPEVIVILPCGYGLEEAVRQFDVMTLPEGWESLQAVRDNRIFAVDASGYFSRPGPRLARGVEILAGILHPESMPVPHESSGSKVARITRQPGK